MRAADPKVIRARTGDRREWGRLIGSFIGIWSDEQMIDFLRLKAGKCQIKVERGQLLEFRREEFLVPIGPGWEKGRVGTGPSVVFGG